MSTTRVWYLLIDHQTNVIGELCKVDMPPDAIVQDLKENIKEDQGLADVDAVMLHAWRLLDPPDLDHLQIENNLNAFVAKISQHLASGSITQNNNQARRLWHANMISELGDWPKKKLHIIVQLPDNNQPPKEPLEKLNTAVNRPELVINLPNFTSLNRLSADELRSNCVRLFESSPFIQKLQEHLQRKRYIEKDELSIHLLPQSLRDPSNRYFECSVPVETSPLDRVTKNELGHYVNIFSSSELSVRATFEQRKEPQVHALLLNFLGIMKSVRCDWGFGTQIPFHLVVERLEESFKYTPRPDFHMRIRDFPHILLEVTSQNNQSDLYRMLLQASCLARLGNTLQASKVKEPVVIMAIYIDHSYSASQYLVYQPVKTSREVEFVTREFDLTAPPSAFDFIFQLYNFVSVAKADNNNLEAPIGRLASAKESVDKKRYKTVTGGTKRKRGTTENSSNTSGHRSSSGAAQDNFGNPSVQEDLVTAGYTLSVMISDELTPLTPLPPTIHRAKSRIGVSVVLKIIRDSNEHQLLEYLNDIKVASNHTIPLLDVIDLSIGKTLIVLPWKIPVDEVLRFGGRPDDVESLCTQFIEGVAFLHQHKVAHCDIKPGNVVIDTKLESKTSPRLYIIDFDIAQFVESEETLTEGWCGTPSWVAPELGSINGPIQRYSPILADRWACGRMIQYFAKYIPTDVDTQRLLAFARQLLSVNPRARPPLNQPRAIGGPTKRRSARSEDEPVRKSNCAFYITPDLPQAPTHEEGQD